MSYCLFVYTGKIKPYGIEKAKYLWHNPLKFDKISYQHSGPQIIFQERHKNVQLTIKKRRMFQQNTIGT